VSLWRCCPRPPCRLQDHSPERLGVAGRASVPVVVEIGENLDSIVDAAATMVRPRSKFGTGVIVRRIVFEAVKAKVDKVARDIQIHGHSQRADGNMRGIVSAQDFKRIRMVVPRSVPELDGMAMLLWHQLEKAVEALGIEPKVRRQLPQNRAALFLQQIRAVEENLDGLALDVELFHLSDEAAALHRKNESVRRAIPPALHHGLQWEPIKSRVDFDGVESHCVIFQLARPSDLRRIKSAGPSFVNPSAGPDKNSLHAET
jgi:hypothetical protein